jgi:hypothetical protein
MCKTANPVLTSMVLHTLHSNMQPRLPCYPTDNTQRQPSSLQLRPLLQMKLHIVTHLQQQQMHIMGSVSYMWAQLVCRWPAAPCKPNDNKSKA